MKRTQKPLQSASEIIAAAYISDDLNLGKCPSEQLLANIFVSRCDGLKVVRVYWLTGEVAWMPCPPGSDMPDPGAIVTAYRRSQASKGKRYPQGDMQCL